MAPFKTFLNLPNQLQAQDHRRIAVLGVEHCSAYPDQSSSGHALAADAIRAASQEDAALVEHWDFDLGGPIACADWGNVETVIGDSIGNRVRIEQKTREVLAQSAVPILIGGDDSVPIRFSRLLQTGGRSGSSRSTPTSIGVMNCRANGTAFPARCGEQAKCLMLPA